MKINLREAIRFLLAASALLPLAVSAQTLTITNGVQNYASLTNTTVTMSGRCELRVTNASNPLSGCTINLNSIDAWLFLTGVKPSVVVSTYLGQIKVNGARAVADSNCRVVQYGQNGAVVIPQASTFQPLTVFTGRRIHRHGDFLQPMDLLHRHGIHQHQLVQIETRLPGGFGAIRRWHELQQMLCRAGRRSGNRRAAGDA